MYRPIARKFRPTRFADVIGQEGVVQTLKNALLFKKTSHAYLFTGLRGTGKTSLARIFAKALNCSSPVDQIEPCNKCSSCKEINAGCSLDVIEIDGASNRGIDDIRKLSENINIATFQGKYRIYIIDEVHMLTKEAFNALLKTLEEPPQNVKFLLATTEPHKILPTILSRCQRFDLRRIDESLITSKLRLITKELAVEVEDDVFLLISSLAEGSLRDAETLLDRILVTQTPPITLEAATNIFSLLPSHLFAKLDKTFASQAIDQIFSIGDEIFHSGFNTNYLLDALIQHYRNILYAYYAPTRTERLTKGQKEIVKQALAIYTTDAVHFILDFLISLQSKKQTLELSRIEIEMILLHIIQTKHRVSLTQVLDSLNKGANCKTVETIPDRVGEKAESQNAPKGQFFPAPEFSNGAQVPEKKETPKELIQQLQKVEPPPVPTESTAPSMDQMLRQETLLRFAAVELGGTLKKHL